MPPSARLTSVALDHGKAMINAGTDRLTSVVRNHKKPLLYVGAALALAGAGSASAATVAGSTATAPLANAPVSASVSAGSVSHPSPLAAATEAAGSASALTAPHAGAHAATRAQAVHAVAGHAATSPAAHKHAAAPQAAAQRTGVRHAAARPAVVGHPAQPQQAKASHRATGNGAGAVAARPRHAHPARHVGPYIFYDSVTPAAIPPHHIIATYATGPYAVPAAQVAGRRVLWIDTIGSDPRASALDIEPTDATPTVAADWARAKLTANPHSLALLYTNISEWPAVRAAVAALPAQMRSHVRWWIADPTGYPHIVPGADATQWYWGQSYDISSATPRF